MFFVILIVNICGVFLVSFVLVECFVSYFFCKVIIENCIVRKFRFREVR